MTITPVPTERVSFLSQRPFDEVLASVEAAIGHPDLRKLFAEITAAQTYEDLMKVVAPALGPTELMLFMKFNLGDVLGKGRTGPSPKSVRLLIGNPVTMRKMTELVPDAGTYAPITVLIDERADGVRLSYDRIASSLQPYTNEQALNVARELDRNVETILRNAAG